MRLNTRIYIAIQICVPRSARKKSERLQWKTLVEFPEDFGSLDDGLTESIAQHIWGHHKQPRWLGLRLVKLSEEYSFTRERRVKKLDIKELIDP